MYPRLYFFGNFFISTYSLIYVIAILVILVMVYFEAKRYGLPKGHFFAIVFWGMLFGVAGGKLFEAIFFQWDYFIENPWRFLSSGAGSMYYGVEVGTLTAVLGYLTIKRLPVIRPLDIAGFGFLLAHAIGRLGCFFGGCCYGKISDSLLAIKWSNTNEYLHPTQLYESIPSLICFFILWSIRKRIKIPGLIFAIYLTFYGMLRFTVEFYRFDAYTFGPLNISPSQHLASISLVTGTFLIFFFTHRYKKSAAASPETGYYMKHSG
jgi:phosphatidylglycerol:prolipoprotein diacylglycerol transferase